MGEYIKLAIATLLPALCSLGFHLLEKRKWFSEMKYWTRQAIYGIAFGALAVLGTEWGIAVNGAQVNCRDAAVLCAGLLFGAPAGIIAGFIGGIERWIAVAWGLGTFTRLACSLSTIIAGFYAAALRKFMFEDRKPSWLISLAIGVIMEVFHLTMVFVTNMSDPVRSIAVVRSCTLPMVIANGIGVMVASILVGISSGHFVKVGRKGANQVKISQTIQVWLFVTVLFAFAITSFFVARLQTQTTNSSIESQLAMAIEEASDDIDDAFENGMVDTLKVIAMFCNEDNLRTLADGLGITEISMIGRDGIIFASSEPEYIGYDMYSATQSSDFMTLMDKSTGLTAIQEFGEQGRDSSNERRYAGMWASYGILQIGYDREAMNAQIDGLLVDITKNRHTGETGFTLIINAADKVVSAPPTLKFLDKLAGEPISQQAMPGEIFSLDFYGTSYFVSYGEVSGYSIVAFLPKAEAVQSRDISLYVNTFMEILVFAMLFALIYLLIKKVIVRQLEKINASLAAITAGNLDEKVDVRTNQEFASLSDDINATVGTLKRYIAEAAKRIDAELQFAKNIQSSALPSVDKSFTDLGLFDICATMDTAKEVGGDFYDFYLTDNENLNFLVADVSGKGIPAAMFMMRSKTELKSLTEAGLPVDEVFTRGNNALCEGNDAGMFVTAWQGRVNLGNGELTFVNAGHNPPLVKHADGPFEYVHARSGLVLAGMEGMKYKPQSLKLETGDIVFLYTDGVTEATNASNELFGEQRLLDALNSRSFDTMKDVCSFIKSQIDTFVGEADQFDDITMLALRYIGDASIDIEEASIDDVNRVTEFLEQKFEAIEDMGMKTVMQMNIAVDEIFSNIVNHGYAGKKGRVKVSFKEKTEPHRILVRFEDEGVPYNPITTDDPDISLSAEERKIGGLGIYMVKKTMDDMKYRYEDGKNILTIMKRLDK